MDYMITFKLPQEADEHFIQTIPAHRAKIDKLINAGVVKSYCLSVNRDTLWMVVEADSESLLNRILRSLPLYEYLVDYTIIPLMFSLNINSELPHISLN